jgi:hypothetical protein
MPTAAASKASAWDLSLGRNAAAAAKGERVNVAAGGSPGRKRADRATTWAPSPSRFKRCAQENREGTQAGSKRVSPAEEAPCCVERAWMAHMHVQEQRHGLLEMKQAVSSSM